MEVKTLLSAVTAAGAGTAVQPPTGSGANYARKFPLIVSGITTATVTIQVSLDGTIWEDLSAITADVATSVDVTFNWIRANVTAYTSGTITVQLGV